MADSSEPLSVVLYTFSGDDLWVDVTASYNQQGSLVVSGYDRGESVRAVWGDWDYEYSLTVAAAMLPALAQAFNLVTEDQPALLSALARRFQGNSAFSALRDFLQEAGIESTFFSWA